MKKIKEFRNQFLECQSAGFTNKTKFLSFEENPENLPFFVKKETLEKIKSGEIKGITTIICGRFGGFCRSKHPECLKLREIKNKKDIFDEELKSSCNIIELLCRRLGKDCQIIFTDKGVSIAPPSWPGDSFGATLYEALKDALKHNE